MKNFFKTLALFVFLVTPTFALFSSGEEKAFSDLSETSKNFDAINYVKEKGIVEGYSDGSFQEKNKINRAEFLKIVLESKEDFKKSEAKKCLTDSSVKPFSDVKVDEWFAPYVCYAKKNGIVQGYEDGSFGPSQEINLVEMAKIITLTQNLKLEESEGEWYLPYLAALSDKSAIPSSVKKLEQQVTRGEMAEVIYRIKANKTNKEATSVGELVGKIEDALSNYIGEDGLGKLNSCTLLGKIMREAQINTPVLYRGLEIEMDQAEESVSDGTSFQKSVNTSAASGEASSDYSETNVQIVGVDEADIVKNDGEFIYLIKGNQVRIVKAYPSKKLEEVGKFESKDESFRPTELFLSKNKLVLVGTTYEKGRKAPEEIESKIWYPHWWSTNFTKVVVLDISDRSEPELFREVSIEGRLNKSRKIGDYAYLVLNQTPNYRILREENLAPENILPRVKDSAKESEEKITECGDVSFFPGFENPNYLTVVAIPVESKTEEIGKKVILGNSENIYMSQKNLYVATGVVDPDGSYWNWDNTQIYKFSIDKTKIELEATGKVEGRILNQFSMDEYKGNFRIATTKNRDWRDEESQTENKLFILDKNLKQLGKIEGIAPGERIKSVRFLGEKAYLVTFETIDPFFVIDLSEPSSPKILGELKIPGWSDYLHPYDENHLIGFGRETKEDAGEDGRFTREDTLGMKVSIFDVTDLKNPKEKFKFVIGERGTESELLHDHKALLFDKERNLLAFPIKINKKVELEEKNCYEFSFSTCPTVCQKRCTPSNCDGDTCTEDCDGPGSCVFKRYQNDIRTEFAGALILNLDLENGISERGRIDAYEASYYQDKEYFYENYEEKIRRILRIGENLYTVSQNKIKAVKSKTVELEKEIKLEK